jgi:hypothetical protein
MVFLVTFKLKIALVEIAFRALNGWGKGAVHAYAVVKDRYVSTGAAQIHNFVLLLPSKDRECL